jgi:hypothetical protein
VPVARLGRWLEGFAGRHGATAGEDGGWALRAADGSRAVLHRPAWLGLVAPDAAPTELALLRPAYGVLLVRRAGYAVGLLDGDAVRERKVGSRHVHGRTAAGGWSQQRYARRRANQADEVAAAAAAAANRILGPADGGARTAQFLVTGGDRPLLAAARALLAPQVAALPAPVHLAVGTPDGALLAAIPDRVLAVAIEVQEPG